MEACERARLGIIFLFNIITIQKVEDSHGF